MRGSTAAGINNPVATGDCSCGGFAGGHLLVVPSGKRPLSGVCWISGSAIQEEPSFLWHSCGFADGAIQEEASFPWHLWYSAHSVPERASCGTEYACGAQNRLLWYAAHFQRHSV